MTDEPPSLSNPVRLMRLMSHDMRGPLSVLTGTSEMFADGLYGPLTPQQTRAIERIRRSSYRLVTLLDDLMGYVKAQAGQYPFKTDIFSPRMLFDEVCQPVREAAQAKNLAVQWQVEDTVPSTLVGDVEVVRRVLLALLWNAVGFTSQGSVQIESAWLPDQRWQVIVRDTGPGISDEHTAHIFEPFWSGIEHPSVPTSGFGLGLAMARAFVQSMQGDLVLKETGPGGSTFCLQLPLSTPEAVSSPKS